jgi:hypothetical protein
MSKTTWRIAILAAALGLPAIAGAGTPPSGFENAPGFVRVNMAPVANPADLSPAERVRIYGRAYAWRRHADAAAMPRRHAYHWSQATAARASMASDTREAASAAPKPMRVILTASTETTASPAAPPTPAAPAAAPPAPAAPAAPAMSMPKFDLSKLQKLHLPNLRIGGAHAPALTEASARQYVANLPIPEWLTIPGHPTVKLPGIGVVHSKFVSAGGILLLALILLMLAVSGSGGARRRRARRNRNFGSGPMLGAEPGPAAAPAPKPAPVETHAPAPAPAAEAPAPAAEPHHGDDHGHH